MYIIQCQITYGTFANFLIKYFKEFYILNVQKKFFSSQIYYFNFRKQMHSMKKHVNEFHKYYPLHLFKQSNNHNNE